MQTLIGLAVVVSVLLAAGAAGAQPVEIEARPPERVPELEVIAPPLREDVSRPTDADYYPESSRVPYDPAFVAPLTVETERGVAGLAGWTSPNTPIVEQGTAYREVQGWFAFGFAFVWGAPPPPPLPR
jgi:hypothetical protein